MTKDGFDLHFYLTILALFVLILLFASYPLNGATLDDLSATLTIPTTLTIGSTCTALTPCNVIVGSSVYVVIQSANVTWVGGAGTVLVYVTSQGVVHVGSANVVVTCDAGCMYDAGVGQFPYDCIPLYTWSVLNGQFTATGVDLRGWLRTGPVVTTGTGLMSTSVNGVVTVSIDPTAAFGPFGPRVTSPKTGTSPCTPVSWAANGTYLYLCIGANVWRRVAFTSW